MSSVDKCGASALSSGDKIGLSAVSSVDKIGLSAVSFVDYKNRSSAICTGFPPQQANPSGMYLSKLHTYASGIVLVVIYLLLSKYMYLCERFGFCPLFCRDSYLHASFRSPPSLRRVGAPLVPPAKLVVFVNTL